MTPMLHISVPKLIGSKLTTSGATNSGVPNKTCNFFLGSYLRAKPKSQILTRFPSRDKHSIFSGCKIDIYVWNYFSFIERTRKIISYFSNFFSFSHHCNWVVLNIFIYSLFIYSIRKISTVCLRGGMSN